MENGQPPVLYRLTHTLSQTTQHHLITPAIRKIVSEAKWKLGKQPLTQATANIET